MKTLKSVAIKTKASQELEQEIEQELLEETEISIAEIRKMGLINERRSNEVTRQSLQTDSK